MISQQTLEGKWNDIKGRLQERWGMLADDDLLRVKGNARQLVGLIQQKTGEAREEVESYLERLASDGQSVMQRGAAAIQGLKQNVGEQAQQMYDETSERLREGYRQAESMVQDRPVESVAVAFGTGMIVGVLVGLMLRSR
jgi:uncharacterized protein YjbJ (UPF0337 family)